MRGLVLVVLALFSTSVFADDFYIEKPRLVGLDDSSQLAVTELLNSSLSTMNEHRVVGSAAASKYQLRMRVVQLGGKYVCAMEKRQGAQVKFAAKLNANQIDEFDIVISRLVRSVVNEVPVDKDARVTDLTKKEAESASLRRETTKNWYFAFGPYRSTNLNADSTLLHFSLGYYWGVTPQINLYLFYDFTKETGSAADINSLGIGGQYFFNQADNAPFAHANFAYGSAETTDGQDSSGFGLGFGLGYQFFRTSKVHLELRLAYDLVLKSNDFGTPGVYGVRLGLHFF